MSVIPIASCSDGSSLPRNICMSAVKTTARDVTMLLKTVSRYFKRKLTLIPANERVPIREMTTKS